MGGAALSQALTVSQGPRGTRQRPAMGSLGFSREMGSKALRGPAQCKKRDGRAKGLAFAFGASSASL